MTVYCCPKGHASTESDYCSECGAKIPGDSPLKSSLEPSSVTPSSPTGNIINCPDCTAPHEPDSGNFCEICGYNFLTGTSGEIPSVSPVTSPSPPPVQTPIIGEILVTIDPSLRTPESPDPPEQTPFIITLEQDNHLIGRTSSRRGIYPEISLDFDDAISHRHALIVRQPNGDLFLRDIGSSNGTQLNGKEVPQMIDQLLKEGDIITLGHWTKLTLKKRNLNQT